jgi:hypothetical protein
MKKKPGWPLWLLSFVGYVLLDVLFDRLFHGRFQSSSLPADIEGAAFAATLTWLFALRKWSKSDSLF